MIFTFGPNDSWYYNDGKRSIWRNVDTDLHNYLKSDSRFTTEKIRSLVIFPSGGFFLTTLDGAYAWERLPKALEDDISKNSAMTNVQRVEIDGHNPPTYLCRTVQPEQMLQSDVSRKCLEVAVGNYFNEGIREIVLGYDSAFVIFGKTGRFNWSVAPDWSWWNETMKRPGVKTAYLSPYKPSRAFVEFSNGTWAGFFPQEWHDIIKKETGACTVC